jgi:hypothetical protein
MGKSLSHPSMKAIIAFEKHHFASLKTMVKVCSIQGLQGMAMVAMNGKACEE